MGLGLMSKRMSTSFYEYDGEGTYYVTYCGCGCDFAVDGTLADAMLAADVNAWDTEMPIIILDCLGHEVVKRSWCDHEYTDDDNQTNPLKFGSSGFFKDWA